MSRLPDPDESTVADLIAKLAEGAIDTGDDLGNCMLARAGDLAGYMRRAGIDAKVATGKTANGVPCTVIMAIGWTAEHAAEVGRAIVARVEAKRREDAERAGRQGPG